MPKYRVAILASNSSLADRKTESFVRQLCHRVSEEDGLLEYISCGSLDTIVERALAQKNISKRRVATSTNNLDARHAESMRLIALNNNEVHAFLTSHESGALADVVKELNVHCGMKVCYTDKEESLQQYSKLYERHIGVFASVTAVDLAIIDSLMLEMCTHILQSQHCKSYIKKESTYVHCKHHSFVHTFVQKYFAPQNIILYEAEIGHEAEGYLNMMHDIAQSTHEIYAFVTDDTKCSVSRFVSECTKEYVPQQGVINACYILDKTLRH